MSHATLKLAKPVAGFRLPGDSADIEPEELLDQISRQRERQFSSLQVRIEQLEMELQSAREESFNVGFQDGLEAEREKHKTRIEAYAQQFGVLAIRLDEEFSQALSDMEEPLLRMSFDLAEKILHKSIPEKLKKEGLTVTLKEFLSEVLHSDSVVIKVSPENLKWIQSKKVTEELGNSFPGDMKFVSDPGLSEGECLVETPKHVIDGSYRHQLDNLEISLK